MTSFSDLVKGPRIFEETYGPEKGPRYWRVFFSIIVLSFLAVALNQIWGTGKTVLSDVKGWVYGSPLTQSAQIGDDNTLVNVPLPPKMGSGNTIVGPTDLRGNTIINQGTVEIGKGACASPGGISIGAGAGGAKCAVPKQ